MTTLIGDIEMADINISMFTKSLANLNKYHSTLKTSMDKLVSLHTKQGLIHKLIKDYHMIDICINGQMLNKYIDGFEPSYVADDIL
jgi:hypothetical protein